MTVKIENIWQKNIPGLREEIMAFWDRNKMLPPTASAFERAMQAVLIARAPDGSIAGITTADIVQFKQLNDNNFFLFRSAILPPFRIPGLISKMIVQTRDFLEEFAATMETNRCIGMLTFVENPSLIRHRTEAVWPASKMIYIGSDKQGRHIRVYYFAGARI